MAVNTEDLAFLEQTLPFWAELTPAQKALVRKNTIRREYPAGEMLHNGSRDCSGVMVVVSGQLRVYIVSDSGKEVTLYRLLDRDICLFSASCAMKNISFEVFVEAEKDSGILLLPTPVYQELAQNSLAVSSYSNQLMQSRFSDVMWLVEQVMFMSFDKRLAIFLLDQAGMEGTDTLKITQETIARHLGSAREVVTRMLKYFQGEGYVRIFRGGIEITSRQGLEKLARA